jgi:anti-sigma B factor antagonist
MDGVTVLRIEGDIDEGGMDMLRKHLMDCIVEQRFNVVVNLAGVRFVSYMGLGVLVERLRQLRSHNGDLKLTGVNLYTQRLIRMVGAKSVFEIYEVESQAVGRFRQAA